MKKGFNDLNISDIVKFHPEQLKTIIAQSSSITNILRTLGLQATNNNARRRVIRFAKENNIELPIYNFKEASTGKTYIKNREEALKILCKGEIHRGTRIRKIVLKYSLLEYKCQGDECQIINGMWGSKKITYHLDHINGDNTDNRIENLRFLCPNCHSFTETYGGKNSKNSKKNRQKSSCLKCEKILKEIFIAMNAMTRGKAFIKQTLQV